MTWFDIFKFEYPKNVDFAEFNDGLLICSKLRYGPIDVWYDCNRCAQDFTNDIGPNEGFDRPNTKAAEIKYGQVKSKWLEKNKGRWIWVKDSELEEHVDTDSAKRYRGWKRT